MPTKKELEAMDLDQIEKEMVEFKKGMLKQRDEYHEMSEVRSKKVAELHYNEAVTQLKRVAESTGKTVDEVAADWIDDGDRGHYVQADLYLRSKKEGK